MSATASKTEQYYESYWSEVGWGLTGGDPLSIPALTELIGEFVGAGESLVDFGCGNGTPIGPIVKAAGSEYLGLDVSAGAVELARKNGFDAQQIPESGGLPFEEGSFDAACAVEVLEHIFDPLGALEEIRRVLKPGGCVIVTCPNTAYWRLRLTSLRGRWNPMGDSLSVDEPWRDPHIRFFTLTTLLAMVEKAGFEVVNGGGHSGGVFKEIKFARRYLYNPSRLYRWGTRHVAPGFLAQRLHAVGMKPAA